MKHGLIVATGMVLVAEVHADYLGLSTVVLPGNGEDVQMVVNLYADFDGCPGQNSQRTVAGAGLPGFELDIIVSGGTFYQNALNPNHAGRTAPPQSSVDIFPSLAQDTFLTIGLKVVPTGFEDETNLTPGFPPEGGSSVDGFWSDTRLYISDGAWFLFDPDAPQGEPGEADNPPLQVLLAQFSVAAAPGPPVEKVSGTLLVQGEQCDGSVFHDPNATFEAPFCRLADINQDARVSTADLLMLLGQWGPCSRDCSADFRGDGVVGTQDLFDLTYNWGPCDE